MKKLVILILALATVAVAYLENATVGIAPVGDLVFDILSLYFPAFVVIVTTAMLIVMRFSVKQVLWSIISGSVAVASSFIWSSLTMLASNWMDSSSIGDLELVLALLLMLVYLLAIPALALGIYFFSMSDALKKMAY